ncbi:addiction module protein [Acidihalobacter ferrooxydans]|uniref:Addiction module antitoxin RelB n=1 Tax=Acidihalobacter ferrooxydans TaxID=1765967 RepID=A0A1P8UIY4_9GAMM|nr:addiction module protein [Acidihalobacter ferrooxydans]APZ43782.1 hypothetical protein BW247_12380 [Acidihalobacter ferrooxydans]
MNISLPLDEMTIEEKLQIMEALWNDLTQHPDQIPPPDWHGKLLADREAAAARGEETFEDWETARQKIEKEIE